MSDADTERILRSLDRIEARLLKLEEREAMRRGACVSLGGFSGLTTGRYYNSRPSTTSLIALSAEAL